MDESSSNARKRGTLLAANTPSAPTATREQLISHSDPLIDEPSPPSPSLDDDRETRSGTGSPDFELDDMLSDDGLEDDEETGLTGTERSNRRRRKRKNAQLDQRVAGGDLEFTDEEDKMATQSVIRASLINTSLILLWYLFSVSISVYNKWMFSAPENEDGQDSPTEIVFPFPLFTTCMHMIVQFTLAGTVLFFFPRFRPRHDSVNPHHAGNASPRREPIDPNKPLMTKWFYLTRLGPCGLATGLDIGLGNMSLKFITLTFYTMCKSTVLGWVLVFAFAFRLEKPSWKLGGIIATMTIGTIMMVAGETAFSVLGFVLIETAAASSGFRWSLTQILLLRNPATSNPFSSIFFLAPLMFLSLLVIALPVEGIHAVTLGLKELMKVKGTSLGVSILLFPGCLAFCMVSCEFALLQRTNVVTLSVCGIFKEVVTIIVANLVFNDSMTPINISGVLITIACIAYYNYIKVTKMREDARVEAHLANRGKYAVVAGADESADQPSLEGIVGGPSTSSLIRNAINHPSRILSTDRIVDNPAKASPVKRPEDLD